MRCPSRHGRLWIASAPERGPPASRCFSPPPSSSARATSRISMRRWLRTFATLFAAFGITYRYAMARSSPADGSTGVGAGRRSSRGFKARNTARLGQRGGGGGGQPLHLRAIAAARRRALADHVGLHLAATLSSRWSGAGYSDRARQRRHVPERSSSVFRCRIFQWIRCSPF